MAIKKFVGNIDVLTAAKKRIKNIWSKASKIYLNFSAGKDSLCLSNIIFDLIQQGEINSEKLVVNFIDEEGLYPSMVQAAERWRKNFILVGAKFNWYCLPFKQVCTLDSLSISESWITWEPGKEDIWMRTPPQYAIVKSDLLHYAGEMNYQTFLDKKCSDGIRLIGVRTAESVTRLQMISRSKIESCNAGSFYPIYDWTDNDVWFYIKENNLKFPEIYMNLYEAGVKKNMLRLSAFFGDKTTQGLRWVAETDPELWEKIEKRMPNAYLVLLYWDSEMFARSSKNRKKLEQNQKQKINYKKTVIDMLQNPQKYRINYDTLKWLKIWKKLIVMTSLGLNENDYKKIYEVLLAGDPKGRDIRSLQMKFYANLRKD